MAGKTTLGTTMAVKGLTISCVTCGASFEHLIKLQNTCFANIMRLCVECGTITVNNSRQATGDDITSLTMDSAMLYRAVNNLIHIIQQVETDKASAALQSIGFKPRDIDKIESFAARKNVSIYRLLYRALAFYQSKIESKTLGV